MPKTIIINDDIVKSGVLTEAIAFGQIPQGIRLALAKGTTPLSNNPAFPEPDFLTKECLKRCNAISGPFDKESAINEISKVSMECSEIEKPYKNNLEKLCMEEVFALFSVPNEKIDVLISLVDGIDQTETDVPFGPDESLPANLTNINNIGAIHSEVYKRTLLNAIVCGASLTYTRYLLEKCTSRLDEFNPRLFDLYNRYLDLNEYLLYYNSEDEPEENQKNLTGIVRVTLGNDGMKNQMDVKATNFSVLLYETVKGILEMFTSHGLPDDRELANAVMAKCDYIKAEPWYMRFGPIVSRYFEDALKDVFIEHPNLMPYIVMKVSMLSPEKFLRLMRETFSRSDRADMVYHRLIEYARKKRGKSDFDTRMASNQSDRAAILGDDKTKP